MLARRLVARVAMAGGRLADAVGGGGGGGGGGDPVAEAERLAAAGADELAVLDVAAGRDDRVVLLDVVARVADRVFLPLTVGGGLRGLDDATALCRAGADRVLGNTAFVREPALVRALADRFGPHRVVAAVDAVARPGGAGAGSGRARWEVMVGGGRERAGLDAVAWAVALERFGAGELIVTSLETEGSRRGFDGALLAAVLAAVTVPVIVSGGDGSAGVAAAALHAGAAGVLAAGGPAGGLRDLRAALRGRGIAVRP